MAKNKVEITGVNTSTLKALTTNEMTNLFISYKNGEQTAKEKLVRGNLK
jgi:RNA polymerase sporulation-specific sigma factor